MHNNVPFLYYHTINRNCVGAEQGTLTFMVGGEDSAVQRATPILNMMGKNIVHCGAAGLPI